MNDTNAPFHAVIAKILCCVGVVISLLVTISACTFHVERIFKLVTIWQNQHL